MLWLKLSGIWRISSVVFPPPPISRKFRKGKTVPLYRKILQLNHSCEIIQLCRTNQRHGKIFALVVPTETVWSLDKRARVRILEPWESNLNQILFWLVPVSLRDHLHSEYLSMFCTSFVRQQNLTAPSPLTTCCHKCPQQSHEDAKRTCVPLGYCTNDTSVYLSHDVGCKYLKAMHLHDAYIIICPPQLPSVT